MDENELRLSVAGFEPGDDVGLARLALGDVGEDFLVDETQGLEVEPGRGWASFLKKISAGFGTLVHPAIAVPNRPPKPGESEKKKRESADFRGRGDGQ